MEAYKQRNGHLNIKSEELDIDGYPLGKKIGNMKKGDIRLSAQQKQELEDFGLSLAVKKRKTNNNLDSKTEDNLL